MTRKQELKEIKKIIKQFYNQADCGLYNSKNIVMDSMFRLFEGEYFALDICFNWAYFEIFGTTNEEFIQLYKYYNNLRRKNNDI